MSHVLLRPVRLRALTSAHAPRRLALGRGPLSDLSRTVKRNPRGRRPTPSYNYIIFQSNIVFLRLCEKRTPSHSHTRSPSRDSVYGAYSTSRAPAAHRSPHGGAPSLPPAARHSPCRPLYKCHKQSVSQPVSSACGVARGAFLLARTSTSPARRLYQPSPAGGASSGCSLTCPG